ncbi:DUF523 domain-containing protein [Desulforegula conservatrix]|uniref:DUF523 domain-containing protein n=1 Tax=Desulforegula conservatrix TaxID=153026 RepID=UPI0004015338|nr:DUF523 domain-containing protein [Desulforegula conservatrix]
MKIVSACLAGINCRYDGKSSPVEEVMNLVRKGEAIPVCPEQFGGLPTPRICCEIKNGMVFTKAGDDVSSEFKKGAEQGLKIALLAGCDSAILKARSPSCGCGKIYDGSFSGKLIDGNGLFAEMLLSHGIDVKTEENID